MDGHHLCTILQDISAEHLGTYILTDGSLRPST